MQDVIQNGKDGYRPVHETGRNEIQFILNALRGLRFGSVEIIVQDSRVIQVQRLEKHRLA